MYNIDRIDKEVTPGINEKVSELLDEIEADTGVIYIIKSPDWIIRVFKKINNGDNSNK